MQLLKIWHVDIVILYRQIKPENIDLTYDRLINIGIA